MAFGKLFGMPLDETFGHFWTPTGSGYKVSGEIRTTLLFVVRLGKVD